MQASATRTAQKAAKQPTGKLGQFLESTKLAMLLAVTHKRAAAKPSVLTNARPASGPCEHCCAILIFTLFCCICKGASNLGQAPTRLFWRG